MSVMSDRWIKRMALEHGMIKPFEASQVRKVNVQSKISVPLALEDLRSPVEVVPPEPFTMPKKVISYGVSSYGYDIRVGSKFKVFTNVHSTVVDPKAFDEKSFHVVDTEKEGRDHVIIPPNSFALGESLETFKIPRDILTICLGKSTYARCGIIVNVTPFEPEWEGVATLEFSNTTTLPAKIYANEGVSQVIFLQGNEPCEVSYKDRKGKYQGQTGVTLQTL